MEIELKIGDVVLYDGKMHLIGKVNEEGGQCDCCNLFKSDDVEVLGNIFHNGEEALFQDLKDSVRAEWNKVKKGG